jgi:acylphosphatase
VSNRPDGAVELVAEGGREALDRLLDWCREGPPLARVSQVEIERSAQNGEFQAFHVR